MHRRANGRRRRAEKVGLLETAASILLATLISCASPSNATAEAGGANEFVVIYSDICFHEEAGDLLGDRFFIIYSEGGALALHQFAEGVHGPPQVGQARIEGSAIRVDFHDPAGSSFTGRLTDSELVGRFSPARTDRQGRQVFHLARQRNERARVPSC